MRQAEEATQFGLGVHAIFLGLLLVFGLAAGLAAGSDGWRWPQGWRHDEALRTVVLHIRLPRTLGAALVGALLGLAGAIAQGLFRNPLADPYLLGTASGASVAVVAVLAASAALGASALPAPAAVRAAAELGIVVAAFLGALGGMALTLALARGAGHTSRLLLAGIVVGVMLTAVGDLLITAFPEALRARQGFLLGSTAYLGWASVAWLGLGLTLALPLAWRMARVLDALSLGVDGARSLGMDLPGLRAMYLALLAGATGLAVSQAGLVAFVGLIAPHVARGPFSAPHRRLLLASAATGAALLLAADLIARTVAAPQELPVGVLTAVLGGGYLLRRLYRRSSAL